MKQVPDSLLALHRMRQQLVKFRTAQINCLRGLLTEYGEVMPKGRAPTGGQGRSHDGKVCVEAWPRPSLGSRSVCRRWWWRPCGSSGHA